MTKAQIRKMFTRGTKTACKVQKVLSRGPKCKTWPNCACILQGRVSDCDGSRKEYARMMRFL